MQLLQVLNKWYLRAPYGCATAWHHFIPAAPWAATNNVDSPHGREWAYRYIIRCHWQSYRIRWCTFSRPYNAGFWQTHKLSLNLPKNVVTSHASQICYCLLDSSCCAPSQRQMAASSAVRSVSDRPTVMHRIAAPWLWLWLWCIC